MENTMIEHKHTGIDSPKIDIKDLSVIKQIMTTKNTSTLSTGGSNSLTTADSTIINNMRTRINELETILKGLGLLK